MAQRIIKLTESDIKNLIKEAINEISALDDFDFDAGFGDDEDFENNLNSKFDFNIPQDNRAKQAFDNDSSEETASMDDLNTDDEAMGEVYLCNDGNRYWIGSREDAERCDASENGNAQMFRSKEEALDFAREEGIPLPELDAENMADAEGDEINQFAQHTEEPEEHHEDGDVIYYDSIPIDYFNGTYKMEIIQDNPNVIASGTNINNVKQFYDYMWDNIPYDEHREYIQSLLDKGIAEYNFDEKMMSSEMSLDKIPIIVNCDKWQML